MRFTRAFIPTLKEAPSDAETVSHRLMLRAGMIRKLASGIYNLLPLGFRVIKKVEGIIREEMDRAGAQEVLMPMVIPAELWKESGRWDIYGKELLRLKDRHDRAFCLGPTHEEVITDMVRREVRSYRELPLNLYQIQTKFRDEIRPRFGLMRGREFIMKDAYSFHRGEDDAEREYRNMYDTYSRIFERCGLRFKAVDAETGSIGGKFSHEFMVLADTGEDLIVGCSQCGYGANIEKAECHESGAGSQGSESRKPLDKMATPGMKSVEEVSAFLKVFPARLIKTLIYETDKGPVVVLVRGDHEINKLKLKNFLEVDNLIMADGEVVEKLTGAPVGFAGPVGLKAKKVADHSVRSIVNGVTGANESDTHFINVNIGRDFEVESFVDIRCVVEGDPCPACGEALRMNRGIEVGHVFKLGTKYSEAMGAAFLDEDGRERPMIMGCYGIGVGRTAAAAIEQNHDDRGIIWPLPIAPFQVIILLLNPNDMEIRKTGEDIYKELLDEGIEALIDDRDERPGVKFNDADLIGIPLRITIGARALKEGCVELKERGMEEIERLRQEEVVKRIREILLISPSY
ncbi:MAG: proline--tRNA ligase [Thermodesulfobacteriota bacterium]